MNEFGKFVKILKPLGDAKNPPNPLFKGEQRASPAKGELENLLLNLLTKENAAASEDGENIQELPRRQGAGRS